MSSHAGAQRRLTVPELIARKGGTPLVALTAATAPFAAIADPHVDHQPQALGDEDCLCLAVTDAPLRLTGRFSRFLNPFLRF